MTSATLSSTVFSAAIPCASTIAERVKPAASIRLILGDQLNAGHSWYRQVDDSVVYVLAEMKQETDYCVHHIQKICAFFSAMREFAGALGAAGHRVLHLTLDDTADFADFPELLAFLAEQTSATSVVFQRPDEWRLQQQLCALVADSRFENIAVQVADSEHFLVNWDEIPDYFEPNKSQRMEFFYRAMRKRYDILMVEGKSEGGKWNYDQDNRKRFKPNEISEIPVPFEYRNAVADIVERLTRHQVKTIGRLVSQVSEASLESQQMSFDIDKSMADLSDELTIAWPITRSQSLRLLQHFCDVCLPNFGKFQDAMTCQTSTKWSLYHSRLSFSLNSKMLHPMQVIDAALVAYRERPEQISLAQVEGFIRQILGWREFVRGIYWANMPQYGEANMLSAKRALPQWFWTGETNMRCMSEAITQSLDFAYAHHIQRLMVTGNFALLAGLSPDEVDAWYLGIYIDAIEWVEMPNTRGMVLFADGGLLGSKPYAASGNYMNKMSDYCTQCAYDVKQKTGEGACPLNSLYWHFLDRHQALLRKNPRMGISYSQWDRVPSDEQALRRQQAEQYLIEIEQL